MEVFTKASPTASVLVVDDHDGVRSLIATILERAGYSVLQAKSAKEAIALVAARAPDIIVTDIFMPEGDGFEIINEIRKLGSNVAVIVVSGSSGGTNLDFLKIARDLGAAAVLSKPFRERELLEAVSAALESHAEPDESQVAMSPKRQ